MNLKRILGTFGAFLFVITLAFNILVPNAALASESNQPALQNSQYTIAQADAKLAEPAVEASSTAGSAALCYTCGGDYPVYGGTIPTPSAAKELGRNCSGSFSKDLGDKIPYLCSKS